MQKFYNNIQNIFDLLFPPECVICKHGGSLLCAHCQSTIHPLRPPFCPHCGRPLAPNEPCRNCAFRIVRLSMLRAFGRYEETLRTCIHALKYDGHKRLAEPLGKLLAWAYRTYGLHSDLIIPVPLHKEREQQRGYNQAALLARQCARLLHISEQEDILLRTRATPAQVGLGGQERLHNVAGAFACSSRFTTGALFGRTILMI